MPRAPRKCATFDCETRGTTRYCPAHTPKWATSTRPGSTRASRKVRAQVLLDNPICQCPGCPRCTPDGCTKPSAEDDHRTNYAAGGSDHPSNHQGMCGPCHRVKTTREAHAGRA